MSNPRIPPPPGQDVATQPHPVPKSPDSAPVIPPDVTLPGTEPTENPALPHPAPAPSPPPAPTVPPTWD